MLADLRAYFGGIEGGGGGLMIAGGFGRLWRLDCDWERVLMRRGAVEEDVLVAVGLGRGAAVERRAAVPRGIVDWVELSWRLLEDWNFLMRRIRGALVFDDIRWAGEWLYELCGEGARDCLSAGKARGTGDNDRCFSCVPGCVGFVGQDGACSKAGGGSCGRCSLVVTMM